MSLVLALLALASSPLGDATPPPLRIEPALMRLERPEAVGQALILGAGSGNLVDLTHDPDTTFLSTNPGVARVERGGLVVAVSDGGAELVARRLGGEVRARVIVRGADPGRPVDFLGEVVPILTRLGCNTGACHGKSSGQNGFRLSLLGGDPKFDHESLSREGRGRRIFPAAPTRSLLIRKPTTEVPHGGGLRLNRTAPELRTLARWISQGGQGPPSSPSGEKGTLVVHAARGPLQPGETRQVRVVLELGEGTERDVTRLSRFDSLAPDDAEIDEHGLVRAGDRAGEAVLSARYRGEIAVARFPIRKPGRGSGIKEPVTNVVDRWILARLDALGLSPSGLCTDAEFARRSALDLAGKPPAPEEVEALERSDDPGKRAAWVDRWLNRPEYADRMAMSWSALLRNQRTLGAPSKLGTFAFHDWIRRSFAANRPFVDFAADLLTARGEPRENPAVIWYRNYPNAEALADDVAPLFLGVRIQCARCHRHPFDRWGPEDYRGFSAFFDRLARKPGDDPATPSLFVRSDRSPSPARWLGGPPMDALEEYDDPRESLADWLRRPDNPYFSRAVVNRLWKRFLGRGLVEPEDDFRPSNPPSHPELLDALASEFVASGHDLKRVVRTILTSRTYQRSSLPPPGDPVDPSTFARFLVRRLPAEVLLDAIDILTGATTRFEGMPPGTRSVQLPDEGFDTPGGFLATFGRPSRALACDCERADAPSLSQSLLLLNSSEIEAKVIHPDGRAARFARGPGSERENVRQLYRLALARDPSLEEQAACLDHLARRLAVGQARLGYEDLIWAILNTKEFQFIP